MRKKPEHKYEPARRLRDVRTMLAAGGASIYDIAARLDVNPRTALRYLQALEAAGEPLTEERAGRRKIWRLMPTARHEAIRLTQSQMVTLFLSRRVFDFLAGTGFKEDLDEVFATLEATIRAKDAVAARNLDRKLYDVNEAPHIYEDRLEHMNDILTALLHEERLRATHSSVGKGQKAFVLEPYSLLVYKKGLYLAGFSHHHGSIRTFALDGFREVDWLKKDKFVYPEGYHPSQLAEGAFGLIGGLRTHVRIRFDEGVARYVERRRWHTTQEIRKVAGGIELTMEVAGTVELVSWVLGFGDKAEVLEPATLREQVAGEMERGAARYRGAPARPAIAPASAEPG
jgi:proteasome accessory factor B